MQVGQTTFFHSFQGHCGRGRDLVLSKMLRWPFCGRGKTDKEIKGQITQSPWEWSPWGPQWALGLGSIPSWSSIASWLWGSQKLSYASKKLPFLFRGLPCGSDGKESACDEGHLGSIPGSGRSPGEGNGNSVFLPGKSHGWRSLVGYSPWGCKDSDKTERNHFHFFQFPFLFKQLTWLSGLCNPNS